MPGPTPAAVAVSERHVIFFASPGPLLCVGRSPPLGIPYSCHLCTLALPGPPYLIFHAFSPYRLFASRTLNYCGAFTSVSFIEIAFISETKEGRAARTVLPGAANISPLSIVEANSRYSSFLQCASCIFGMIFDHLLSDSYIRAR